MRTHYFISSVWMPVGVFRFHANSRKRALEPARRLADKLRPITNARVTVRRVKETNYDH